MTQVLSGPDFYPESDQEPSQLVILLHGLGADGHDLIGLATHWASVLPRTRFIAPNAPFPCDIAPMGRQWFSVEDRSPERFIAGVDVAAPILDSFIDAELARSKVASGRTAIVGFSQGTMMALHVALRRAEPIAAIVGYSGRLIAAERLADEIRARPPTMLIHGDADSVVPFDSLAAATDALEKLDVPVTGISRPGLGHAIDEYGLSSGGAFLQEHFGD